MNSSPSLHLCCETAVRSHHEGLESSCVSKRPIFTPAQNQQRIMPTWFMCLADYPAFLASHFQQEPGQSVSQTVPKL